LRAAPHLWKGQQSPRVPAVGDMSDGPMRSPAPLVSVIIPAFNCALFISDTLESVCQQTYKNWEIVLIDDGSTDETRSVLAPHLARVRYFYQENKGTAAARNAGIQRSRGELVAFLDHDDLWFPNKLELQVRAIQSYPECGLVFTDGKSFDGSGILKDSLIGYHLQEWIDQHQLSDPAVATGEIFQHLFFGNVIASASSVLVRKQSLESIGCFDERISIADDYDLWLRIALSYPVVLLSSCLYMWRYREDSQSGPMENRYHRWTRACITVLEKHSKITPAEIRPAVRARLSRMYWDCGKRDFCQNRFRDSRDMFLGCLRYHRTFFARNAVPFGLIL